MARVKGVKRLKDEPGFNGAIGESTFHAAKSPSLLLQYTLNYSKKDYVPIRWMSEASLSLVCRLQYSSDFPKFANRLEKNHQFKS